MSFQIERTPKAPCEMNEFIHSPPGYYRTPGIKTKFQEKNLNEKYKNIKTFSGDSLCYAHSKTQNAVLTMRYGERVV